MEVVTYGSLIQVIQLTSAQHISLSEPEALVLEAACLP